MSRPSESRSVVTLGIILIVLAFLWSCLSSGGVSIGSWLSSGFNGGTRSVMVMNAEGETFVSEVSNNVFDAETTAQNNSSDLSASSGYSDFSFTRDFLGIYQEIHWGSIIRGAMYALGVLLLLLSNIKVRR